MLFRLIPIFLIIALGSIAVLGFLNMNCCASFCLIGSLEECPVGSSSLISAVHHITGLQKLSLGNPILMLFLWFLPFSFLGMAALFVFRPWPKYRDCLVSKSAENLLDWIALHRKRDPSINFG